MPYELLAQQWLLGTQAEKSVFHGKAEKNFAGVSWLEPPKNARAENEYCYLPKRWIHTWSGHTKVRSSCVPSELIIFRNLTAWWRSAYLLLLRVVPTSVKTDAHHPSLQGPD